MRDFTDAELGYDTPPFWWSRATKEAWRRAKEARDRARYEPRPSPIAASTSDADLTSPFSLFSPLNPASPLYSGSADAAPAPGADGNSGTHYPSHTPSDAGPSHSSYGGSDSSSSSSSTDSGSSSSSSDSGSSSSGSDSSGSW